MTQQPTGIPGQLFDQPNPTSAVPSTISARRDNEFAFHVFHGEHPNLPAPSYSPRHDGMFINVADVDDLVPWLAKLNGEIHRSPVFEGMSLWTLHTSFPWIGGRRIPIRVSVAVLADELVMDSVRKAVVR